ncbi:hypothetical protein ABIE21_003284 [Conyzicola nivalis]|uniref:Uncharacterized protein n=1 Tax=Conyzicola nivalis TaxID=1477021 RepID=A0ABV2QTF7_9MICO
MQAEDDRAAAQLGKLTGTGRLGEDRSELTLKQRGQWLVLSATSAHFFDLDGRTVNRMPGRLAVAMITDEGRPIRTIESCRVGEVGYWTMEPFGHEYDLVLRWHQSTEIRRIVQVLGLERPS